MQSKTLPCLLTDTSSFSSVADPSILKLEEAISFELPEVAYQLVKICIVRRVKQSNVKNCLV
jgi:hypothetical protein